MELFGRAALGDFGHTDDELTLMTTALENQDANTFLQRLRRRVSSGWRPRKMDDKTQSASSTNHAANICLSKYSLDFGLRAGATRRPCTPFKYMNDVVFIRNDTKYECSFKFLDDFSEESSDDRMHIKIKPKSGVIPPGSHVRIVFEMVLLSTLDLKVIRYFRDSVVLVLTHRHF